MRAKRLARAVTWWACALISGCLLAPSAAEEQHPQSFATMPSHQTAVLGSTAVLPCRVLNRKGTVQWTRDGFGLGTVRKLIGFERYSMIGADEEGDFSLRISPVTLEDDAEYQCQVSSTKLPMRSQVARLTVFVPPQPPTVTHDPVATAGVNHTLTCSSSGGKPAPEIQWLDGTGAAAEIHEGVYRTEELMADGKRVNAHATLTFIPSRHHHGKTLTCLTHNPALNTPLAAKVHLNVQYPPEVQLKFTPAELLEGVEASVTCKVSANPGEVKYRWFRGGTEVPGAIGATLPLGVLSRTDHMSPVACEVTNSVGTTRKIQPLNVRYPPMFVAAPSSESAEPGDLVTLKCRVDANPPPEIIWSRADNHKIVGTGPELIVSATTSSAGVYVCSAESPGFSPLEGRVHLRLRGPPYIKTQAVVAVREGHPAVLKCGIVAVPHPVAVTWRREGVVIASEEGHHLVDEQQKADGVVSTLTINKTKHSDFATYNCSVINEYGVDTRQIVLQRKPLVPLMMIVGGGAGVVFVVIVVILFIICGRRSSSHKDKAAEAGAGVVEKGVVGLGGSGGLVADGGTTASMGGLSRGSSLDTPLKVMPNSLLPSDNHSTGQDSDHKDAEIRTTSSLSATERDSDSGWERESSSKASPREAPPPLPISHTRYSVGSSVFTPPDQGYMSYVDYTRDYSPVPVSVGESYAQFQVGGPYARSTPACSDPPSSLPSSVAPPPYTPSPHATTVVGGDLNGGINGRINPSSNGKVIVNGSGGGGIGGVCLGGGGMGVNGTLKHALLQDLKQELKREAPHDLDSGALHSKYIIPPQTKIKPGTLV